MPDEVIEDPNQAKLFKEPAADPQTGGVLPARLCDHGYPTVTKETPDGWKQDWPAFNTDTGELLCPRCDASQPIGIRYHTRHAGKKPSEVPS